MTRVFQPKFDWGDGGGKERKSRGSGPKIGRALEAELMIRQGGLSPILGVPLAGREVTKHHKVRTGGGGRNDLNQIRLETLSEHAFEHYKGMREGRTLEEQRDEEAAMLGLQQRMSDQERQEFAALTREHSGTRVYFTKWSSPEEKRAHRREVERRRRLGLPFEDEEVDG